MANEPSALIAILGGTFDPVHCGHCDIALRAGQQLRADQVFLMPSYLPVHRQARASTEQRVAMLKLALAEHPSLALSTLEIEQEKPSYTVETVARLRANHQDLSLVFLLGMDAFCHFDSWRNWQQILDYVHLGVVGRPGASKDLTSVVAELLANRQVQDVESLHKSKHGNIILLDIEGPSVSATALRERLQANKAIADWVPESVANYIAAEKLYT